jgi:hypothetical protein
MAKAKTQKQVQSRAVDGDARRRRWWLFGVSVVLFAGAVVAYVAYRAMKGSDRCRVTDDADPMPACGLRQDVARDRQVLVHAMRASSLRHCITIFPSTLLGVGRR